MPEREALILSYWQARTITTNIVAQLFDILTFIFASFLKRFSAPAVASAVASASAVALRFKEKRWKVSCVTL